MHSFRGSFGAKDAFPLYRDAEATEPNILPGFLASWGKKLKRNLSPESFAAYAYAVLGHNRFVERFWNELEECQLRVPLTLDAKLFDKAVAAGSRLLFLHTFGERFAPDSKGAAEVLAGSAKVKEGISEEPTDYPESFEYSEETRTLHVGGGSLAPVDPAIWAFEVSGLKVVASWLGYRMKNRTGKKSSPLDDIHPERWTSDFTDELLRLLWVLEHTLAMQPELTRLLDAVCNEPMLLATDLPGVPVAMRKPPGRSDSGGLFDDDPDDEELEDDE